jgi:hypothetical protein
MTTNTHTAVQALRKAREAIWQPSYPDLCQEIDEALSALEAAPALDAQGEAIHWTLNGDKTCGYTNWLGVTPFGRILITWKSWKDHPTASVDEFPGDLPRLMGDPEWVKEEAEAEYLRRLAGALPHAVGKPLSDEHHPDFERALIAHGITVWGPRAEDFEAGYRAAHGIVTKETGG